MFVALLATLHVAPAKAAEVVTLPPPGVQEVLSGVPLEDLNAAQLSELLAQLPGLSALPPSQLQEELTKAIETLAGEKGTLADLSNPTELVSSLDSGLKEALSPLTLLSLLKGESLSTLLSSGLGTPEATELLGGLLSTAPDAKQLTEQVLAAVNGEGLNTLLGTTLTNEPVNMVTVEELAGQLGTTDEGLAEALGKTTTQLPANALALTKPLSNGKTLGMVNGVEGLTLGLLTPSPKEEGAGGSGGGAGGTGGAGGSGGSSGGSGGTGSGSGGGTSGTTGGMTVIVNPLASPSSTATAATTQSAPAKVRILSRRVRGHVVTLLVQISGAGTVVVSGRGLKTRRSQASRAERVTLRASLTRAAVGSLRAHGRRQRIAVRVSFTPVGGHGSAASTAVTFG